MTTPKPEDVEARAREIVNDCELDDGACHDHIAAALLSERVATARACAKVICEDCRAGKLVLPFPSSDPEFAWCHIDDRDDHCVHQPCSAIYAAFPEAIPGKGEE